MNPQSPAPDGFRPKWRNFHPLTRVWLQNPFDHDVIFQVADEQNGRTRYRLPAHKVSELPGGAIATLGVKAIVDELIQNDKNDAMRLWDENVRAKHEKNVILRIKETSPSRSNRPGGEIDLSVASDEDNAELPAASQEEEAFPGMNDEAEDANDYELDPVPSSARENVSSIAAASLPATDTVLPEA